MSDTTTPRDGPDSWPDTCTLSALGSIEASSGPIPRVSLRDDVDGDATTVKADPGNQGRSSSVGPGRYAILGEIARGGMGAVLRGHDSDLNRDLAIKVLLEKYAENVEVLGRFIEEAQIGGQLQHPGIVPVYELGQFPDKRPFFAMKLVKGRTLAELLQERSSPADNLPRFLKIFEQICETMAYAHSKGVIHRDLKPLNVMVGAFGEVQVMDWGLAKILGRKDDPEALKTQPQVSMIRTERSATGSNLTEYGDLMGTAAYMPPEQARGEIDRLDERTDVFALGSILCEVLTGHPAYMGRTQREMIDRSKVADLADARARLDACGCDPDLIAIATACLAPVADDRPRDASEVARRTAAYLASVQERLRASELARVKADVRAENERARRQTTLALAAAVVLAVALGGSILAFRLDRQRRQMEDNLYVSSALARAEAAKSEAERSEGVGAWDLALVVADKAKASVPGRAAHPDLADRIGTLYTAVANRTAEVHARAEKGAMIHRLAERLDEARLEGAVVRDGHFDAEAKDAAYARAFDDARIDLWAGDPMAIAATLGRGGDAERIAAVLDDWAQDLKSDPRRENLDRIARAIDPDRNPLRDAIARKDRSKLVALAEAESSRDLTGAGVQLLVTALRNAGAEAEAIRLLMEAQKRSPGDFWINEDLGKMLMATTPSRPEEAVRYWTAALALRPISAGTHVNLGFALRELGKPGEAIQEFRHAIRLKPDFAKAHINLAFTLSAMGKTGEAVDEYRETIRLKPDYATAHNNLGAALRELGKPGESAEACREAIRLNPDYADAHSNLGNALSDLGKPVEAADEFREATRLKPDFVVAYNNLGAILGRLGRWGESAEACREAIRLNPEYAIAHLNLGNALRESARSAEAVDAYRRAIQLNPDFAVAHAGLGGALMALGKPAEAADAYREAIRLKPNYAEAHFGLGAALRERKPVEAVDAYREAIRLKPDYAQAHYALGAALGALGKPAEAADACREAIRLKPDYAEAYCGLGAALRSRGLYREALASLRTGHELGSKRPDWMFPSAERLRECEALVALEDRLPGLLKGEAEPKDLADRLALGQFCYDTKRFAASARFWGDALANDPKLGDDRKDEHRYNAACSAAMAGSGQGIDDPKPDDAARAKLRDQARAWLRAELSAWKKVALTAEPGNKELVAKTLRHWKADADLAGVRDADALARLPEAERAEWRGLWVDVDSLLQKVGKL